MLSAVVFGDFFVDFFRVATGGDIHDSDEVVYYNYYILYLLNTDFVYFQDKIKSPRNCACIWDS